MSDPTPLLDDVVKVLEDAGTPPAVIACVASLVDHAERRHRAVAASRKELFEALLALKGSFSQRALAKVPNTVRLVDAALDNAGRVSS
jgi:hypothetical protein